jgi:DNA-binding NtrC family response regulator
MSTIRILIVDKEFSAVQLCPDFVSAHGCQLFVASTPEEALDTLDRFSIDAVIVGINKSAPHQTGWLQSVRERHPETRVVYLADDHKPMPMGQQARRSGARGVQPSNMRELIEQVVDSVVSRQKTGGNARLRAQSNGSGGLIGVSAEMQRVYRLVAKVSQHTYPVVVLGESGTGKELVARSIHFSGPRRDGPFVPVDCSSLVPTLMESELFGYVKGAFTGAYRSKQGLVESAEGGTLFLDEIGDLALDLQSKLLRIVQESEVRPLGSTERHSVSIRVIAATNRNLEQLVREGKFREDLYFRLNVVQLALPSLRRRKGDIPLLASHFFEKFSRLGGHFSTVSDEALKQLLAYDWPGNVRELENAIEYACALGAGPILRPEHLPLKLQNRLGSPAQSAAELLPLGELERRAILLALREANGDKTAAARILGIGKSTLYRRLRQFDSSARRSPGDLGSQHPNAS